MDAEMNNNAANKLATKYLGRTIFLLLVSDIEIEKQVSGRGLQPLPPVRLA